MFSIVIRANPESFKYLRVIFLELQRNNLTHMKNYHIPLLTFLIIWYLFTH